MPTIGRVLASTHQIDGALATAAAAGGAALTWWNPDGATPGGAGGIWAYAAKGAASFAASLLDLSGNGNNAVNPGGTNTPGWDAVNGWDFNSGATVHLITTFVANMLTQSQTVLMQFNDVGAATRWAFGSDEGAGVRFGILCSRPLGFIRYYNGNFINAPPLLVAGNVGIAGNQGYRNGIADGGAIAPGAAATIPTYIGGYNNGGVPGAGINGYISLFVVYEGIILTAPQMLARATAMATL